MPEREEEWVEGRCADDAEHEGAKEGEAVRALRPMGRVAREELHVLLSRVSERRHLMPAAAGESGGGSEHTHTKLEGESPTEAAINSSRKLILDRVNAASASTFKTFQNLLLDDSHSYTASSRFSVLCFHSWPYSSA